MRWRVVLLELGQLLGDRGLETGNEPLELGSGRSRRSSASSSADSSRGEPFAPSSSRCAAQLCPQARLLAPRVMLERLVDRAA